jgi:hypothetical protein
MKQQKQETPMHCTNSELEWTNDAIRELRRCVRTATQLEPDNMPEMLRLIRNIERLNDAPRHRRRPQHERSTAEHEKWRYVRRRTGSAPLAVPSSRCAV